MKILKTQLNRPLAIVTFVILLLIIAGTAGRAEQAKTSKSSKTIVRDVNTADMVIPVSGYTIPISWNGLGSRLVEAGVIDKAKFEEIYDARGGLSDEEKELSFGTSEIPVVITRENSGLILNLLWAFGLSNKNPILTEGEMTDEIYGGDASRFASTGGWSLAVGDTMDHYSKYNFVSLTDDQQRLVEDVSNNIYRPCCGNPTHFPDCNHGMAMLGLLQLLASEGLSEGEIYDAALVVNSYWFPETYLTLATYFESKGIGWNEVDSKLALSADYSSGFGYQNVLREVDPVSSPGGGGCSV